VSRSEKDEIIIELSSTGKFQNVHRFGLLEFGRSSLNVSSWNSSSRPLVFLGRMQGSFQYVFVKVFPSENHSTFQWLLSIEKSFDIATLRSQLHYLPSFDHFTLPSKAACIVWPRVFRCPLFTLTSFAEYQRFCRQLLESIRFCESNGLWHGDLKPENMGVDSSGNLTIIDWERNVKGTEGYVAPEIESGQCESNPRSDLWSAGEVMRTWLNSIEGSSDNQERANELILTMQRGYQVRNSASQILEMMDAQQQPTTAGKQSMSDIL
jgi:hypothetical protein